MARPTNRVREIVPAASGWRAMASRPAAIERPSASAGPIAPNETAKAAARMLIILISMVPPLAACGGVDRGADEDGCEHGEDVGLDQAQQNLERHERDR